MEEKELEAKMVVEELACCGAKEPPVTDYKWEHPDIVKAENEEGEVGSMIFPFGVKHFAHKHDAEVIYVGDGYVTYFSEGRWKALDDSIPSTPSNLGKLRPV